MPISEMKDKNDVLENESILQYITAAIQDDGKLPNNFCVNKEFETKYDNIGFVDGFLDGSVQYSLGPSKQDAKGLFEIIRLASNNEFQTAAGKLNNYFYDARKVMAINVIDDAQDYVYKYDKELSASNLAKFAFMVVTSFRNIEAIKFALVIIELFDLSDIEEVMNTIKTLALCNEFTLFCVFATNQWANHNDMVFEMAQKVSGWGRVFAVTRLKPETDEIKKWLLYEGWDNDVDPAYTALEIANNCDILTALHNDNISKTEYKNIGRIIDALLNEGPVEGISAFENKAELLNSYLLHARNMAQDIEDFEIVYDILMYINNSDMNEKNEIKAKCGDVLVTTYCKDVIQQALLKGKGYQLAQTMEIPCAKQAYDYIKADPINNDGVIEYALTDQEQKNKAIFALYSKVLPLEKMATGPDTWTLPKVMQKEYMCLSYILQFLDNSRGVGEDLIICALNAPVVNCRNGALNVVESWLKAGVALSERLKAALMQLRKTEIKTSVRERLDEILL